LKAEDEVKHTKLTVAVVVANYDASEYARRLLGRESLLLGRESLLHDSHKRTLVLRKFAEVKARIRGIYREMGSNVIPLRLFEPTVHFAPKKHFELLAHVAGISRQCDENKEFRGKMEVLMKILDGGIT
jgi:hypothetical protein